MADVDAVTALLRRLEATLDASLSGSDSALSSGPSSASLHSLPSEPSRASHASSREYELTLSRLQLLGDNFLSRHRLFPSDIPERSAEAPPAWARPFYKVLASQHGQYLSVFDGQTVYALGQTLRQRASAGHAGGIYVFRTIEDCLRRDAEVFPSQSELIDAPRVVARCLCWMPRREDEPIRYGGKLAFTFVRLDRVMPYPQTTLDSIQRPGPAASDPRSGMAAVGAAKPGGALGGPAARGGGRGRAGAPLRSWEASLLRAQAQTVALEEEVGAMEAGVRDASRLRPAADTGVRT